MDRNIERLCLVARKLGPLRERVVFLGGATTSLLVTDPAAPPPRPTKDVDLIIEVGSRVEYSTTLREQLLDLGFREDTDEDAPVCRWVVEQVKVDIMPTEGNVLGFSNRWYGPAMREATPHELPDGTSILVISAPHFVAAKIEAFRNRGKGDYLASHDLEDLVFIVDGRAEIVDEVQAADEDLREYLAHCLGELLDTPGFLDALPGHLPGDAASQRRLPSLREKLKRMAGRR
jgi:predicted nucleotidyltransferase